MRRFFLLVCVVWLVANMLVPQTSVAATASPNEPISPLSRSDFIGMVVRDPYYEWGSDPFFPAAPNRAFQDSMGATLAQSGVKWVRFEFHIGGDIEADLAKHDYFINEVAPRHGLKVLALLSFDLVRGRNLWDLNDTADVSSRFGGGVNSYMNEWLDRALRIADRYHGAIAAYEMLNEQNRLPPSGFGINPVIVSRLTAKFYRFCHNINTPIGEPFHTCGDAQIIIGGLHPRGTSDTKKPSTIALTDEQYLTTIYTAGPFSEYKKAYGRYPVDGIGYHPYPEEVRLSPNYPRQVHVDTGVDRMLRVIATYDPGKPLWITEIGYNVAYPGNSESELWGFINDIYTTLAARPQIANVFWFKYEDFGPWENVVKDGKIVENAQKWGLVRIPFEKDLSRPDQIRYQTNGTPIQVRSTYWALRALAGIPAGPPQQYLPIVNR